VTQNGDVERRTVPVTVLRHRSMSPFYVTVLRHRSTTPFYVTVLRHRCRRAVVRKVLKNASAVYTLKNTLSSVFDLKNTRFRTGITFVHFLLFFHDTSCMMVNIEWTPLLVEHPVHFVVVN